MQIRGSKRQAANAPALTAAATSIALADLHAAAAYLPPPDRQPAADYLASLAAGPGRRNVCETLDRADVELSLGHCDDLDLTSQDVRFRHATARCSLSHDTGLAVTPQPR